MLLKRYFDNWILIIARSLVMNLRYIILLILCVFSTRPDNAHIVALSIPKSGSFLLYKCIQLITDKVAKHAFHADGFIEWDDYFLTNHELPIQQAIETYKKQNIKAVFIYRDPRDQVVSSAYFFKDKIKHPKAIKMTIEDLITDSIINSCQWWKFIIFRTINFPLDLSVATLYEKMMPWAQQNFVYVTTFERLVGPKGGGNRDQQVQEIMNIAYHIQMPLSKERAEEIADLLFGRFETFRHGKIGAWKKEFTIEHKSIFKQNAGELLINLAYESDLAW